LDERKVVPYREDEPQLEFIEDDTPHVELWGTEVDKKLMTTSTETLNRLLEVENKGIIVDINPKELRLSPLNPRQKVCESRELKDLRQNIFLNKKVYEPLLVRIVHGVPEILKGGLRWRISVLGDLETVPVLVKSLSDEEAISEIESSGHSVELDPVSRGEWYATLMKQHGSLREVGRIAKVSYEKVSNYLTICSLPDTTKEVVREGKMSYLVALDILKELNEVHYGKIPPREVVSYTKEYLRLRKDKRKPLTRQGFKEWMRTKRTRDVARKLADYGYPEKRGFVGKPYESKAEREIEKMKRETDETFASIPSGIAEKKAKALLESAPEEVQKEYEGKVFGKDYSLPRLMHDITVAEGNEPLKKIVELEGNLFKTEREADKYFKQFGGRLLEKRELWVGEVDPFLYAESKKEKQ